MMIRHEVISSHPNFPWIDAQRLASVEAFLRERDWLDPGEACLSVKKAGEGNMNLTLRIGTDRRSFILKQARPWVEKYDHIPAPWDRIIYERGFYERVAGIPEVAGRMPKVLAEDTAARAMVLEDLGEARDFTDLYRGARLTETETRDLGVYLSALHEGTRDKVDEEFTNRAMRELNHEHIFRFPLDPDNGLDLDAFEPGLREAAEPLWNDAVYRDVVEEAGRAYLQDGPCLLHGDFFPGSWLRTASGIRIIDPEFCFFGQPEFDLGVFVAHMRLADQPAATVDRFLAAYGTSGVGSEALNRIARTAGIEIMRRLIGVAQLPLQTEPPARARMLAQSHRATLGGRIEELWS